MMLPDYLRQPPAWFHTRILVGAGAMLTPRFAVNNGITHVINCAFDEDSPEWFRNNNPSKYVSIKAFDTLNHNILSWYPFFETSMRQFLREGNGVIYVHCQAGMNRSGFLALTYVCKNFNLDLDHSVVSFRRQRPVLLQNMVYMNQVKEFINGRVSSEKNQGQFGVDKRNGDTGLSSSGNHTEFTGIDIDTGKLEFRTGHNQDEHIQIVFEQ